jgi:integrase
MASISTDRKGNRRIFFTGPNRNRKIVYLGAVPMKTARTIKVHIENLAAALLGRHAPDPETSEWVGGLDDLLYGKLAAVGLLPDRGPAQTSNQATTLGPFLEQYLNGRTDIKPSTRTNLEQVRRNLLDHFGPDKPLADIAPGDADEFRINLLGKLGENTVRRNCGRARQFFRAAVRKRLIQENPFGDMKGCAVKATTDRFHFVTRAEADMVLAACPDAQWRLLFALSRYGGLRCPSEHLALRWADVDWERNRITVHSPKTEHHEGKECRDIPLFPELRPYLEEVWEQAEPGTEYVITRYRSGNANLRTQLERIIRRAGLTPWPKPFQNCRSTRETELAEEFPIHVVCAWIGNTQAVAAKHYLQVREEDFARAAERDADYDARATQNTTQQRSGDSGTSLQETTQALEDNRFMPECSRACNNNPNGLAPRAVQQTHQTCPPSDRSYRSTLLSPLSRRQADFRARRTSQRPQGRHPEPAGMESLPDDQRRSERRLRRQAVRGTTGTDRRSKLLPGGPVLRRQPGHRLLPHFPPSATATGLCSVA